MPPEDSYTRYPRTILWLVPGGEVTIGGDEADASPVFRVDVEPFYLSKWPITNEQFEAFGPSDWRRSPLSPGNRHTAVGVTWEQAAGYCRWYAEVSRKPMRLPSEIEWEYACRGGCESRYFWGNEAAEGDEYLWDADNSDGHLHPADSKKGNGFGLHAMLGGVWEWTASTYVPYPLLTEANADNGESESERVLRGGSFRVRRVEISCSARRSASPTLHDDDVGFRVAKSLR